MSDRQMVALSIIAAALLAAPVCAQTDAAGQAATVKKVSENSGDIVVTARKREEAVQNVPISITAFSGDTLIKQGVRDFKDLGLNNPNVTMSVVGPEAIAIKVAIRGNIQSNSIMTVDPSVGTYIDGHIIAHTYGGSIALGTDIASVQTLKGPQGTLFGRNTTGGAILVTTRDPQLNTFDGYLRAEVGNVDTRRIAAAVNAPLGDKFAIRVAFQDSRNGDYETFTNGLKLGDYKGYVVRGKLLFQPDDATQIILTGEKEHELAHSTITNPDVLADGFNPPYHNVPLIIYPPGSGLDPGQTPSDPRADRERNLYDGEFYGLNASHEVGKGNVKLIVGHRAYDVLIWETSGPLFGYSTGDKPNDTDTSIELQYAGKFFNDRLDFAGGLYHFRETVHEDQQTFLFSGLQYFSRFLTAKQRSYSAYAQGTAHITDRLNLTLGGRYTTDKKFGTLHSATLGAFGLGTPEVALANPTASNLQKNSRFNYMITVDYSPLKDVLLYATHSTGYRAGGTGVDRQSEDPSNPLYYRTAIYLPESIKNYETGFKTQFLDRILTFNVSAFYQDYKNYQYGVVDPVTIQRVQLNSDAIIKGFELEGGIRLRSGTALNGSVGYVSAKINDTASPSNHETLPGVPKWNYSIILSQALTVAGGDLDLVANFNWRSTFHEGIEDPRTPESEIAPEQSGALGLLNLSATYKKNRYTVALFANNVTNKHYYTGVTDVGPGVVSFAGIGLPRVIGARGQVDF